MNKVRLAFTGGNYSGRKVLEDVLKNRNVEVVGVIPNKSDYKSPEEESISYIANTEGVPIISLEEVSTIGLDALLSVHSERIIREPILNHPKHGCFNVHFSLLPNHKGMFPLGHAILEGDSNAGVTLYRMDEGIDTGDILHQQAFPISRSDTYHSLYLRGTEIARKMVGDFLDTLGLGNAFVLTKQVGEGSYHDNKSYPPHEIDLLEPERAQRTIRALTSPRYDPPYIKIGDNEFTITPRERKS